MPTLLTAAPTVEPVSLAEAKAHLRIDTNDEDGLIQSLIMTSRLHIEVALNLALITQSWSCFFDGWPEAKTSVALPVHPVQSVNSIKLYADDGTFIVLPTTDFSRDLASRPARVSRRAATLPPRSGRAVNGIEIAITAGFGADPADVPMPIRHALLQLVAHWYEHRDPSEAGTEHARIPTAVSNLLAPWAPIRL